MVGYDESKKLIADAAATFPETFGLRAYPGDKFRVSQPSSYVNDSRVVMLYTEILMPDGKWSSFAKGTPQELRREVVKL